MKLGHLPTCVDEIGNTEHRVLTKTFQTRVANKNNYYAKIPFAIRHVMKINEQQQEG